LGPLAVERDGAALALPASRKVRALLAYLALAPGPVPRGRLCDLFWDGPDDPRGELRWCLSRLRRVLDEPGRPSRVLAQGDTVRLDLADGEVDALEVARSGGPALSPERLRTLAARFRGDFLDGLELDRSPAFQAWLVAQRRRFRGCHAALLERLARGTSGEEALAWLERWLELDPLDEQAHGMMLAALARRRRLREGDEHVAAAARLLAAEGLDAAPVRARWHSARQDAVPRTDTAPPPEAPPGPRRASLAVMPFLGRPPALGAPGGPAHGLAHDVITRLAKLRSLFVIAQGTVLALHERGLAPAEAARLLGVDYVASGALERRGKRLAVTVELAEAATARIVWAERFERRLHDTLLTLDEIGERIVAALASEIEASECRRAVLRPPGSLDAWETYHRGLWHMYRFSRADNERARALFEAAIRLDPTFARAHAGLSFTHFQNAFQGWAPRAAEAERAYAAAGRSLLADDRDPAAHWAMGRALWLRGRQDGALGELEQAVGLSPNFALGHYTLAFVQSQAGDAAAAIASADHSRRLSPCDPLLFGMLGARAMALARLGRFEEAADWGVRAAARPNAHAHIQAIAALSLALAGRPDEARGYLAASRALQPGYHVDDFLAAMRFSPDDEALFRRAAERIGRP
jgi:DNA-binding SARP family transcriptional activator/TolB-like protein